MDNVDSARIKNMQLDHCEWLGSSDHLALSMKFEFQDHPIMHCTFWYMKNPYKKLYTHPPVSVFLRILNWVNPNMPQVM